MLDTDQEGRPGRFTADPQLVFAATIDTIRALPAWEVVSADPQLGEIRTARKRRFRTADQHRVTITPDPDGSAVHVERIDRVHGPHLARAREIEELLAGLEHHVDVPRPHRR